MTGFCFAVRALALIALVTGCVDVVVGLKGQHLIGAALEEGYGDPVLNSQIRYLGAIWFGFGALLWVCSSNLEKYSGILNAALWIVVLGGVGRLLSLIQFGLPTSAEGAAFVLGAMAIELIVVPAMLYRQGRLTAESRRGFPRL
ncbi:DUF4345 domain-containing protein [Solimonas sp. K1W22B-7]|uniref:DUF4345 domain-containing protein n=1 Tax=Solimonas sp. K1W22B-7 TaxID=2303331 RepID=UPI000E337265|nr:DUF4345 domain-containing protein [Solimonas sp. K1W22B-7]